MFDSRKKRLQKTKLKAVLFDLDGVLIDSSRPVSLAIQHALTACSMPSLPPEILRPHLNEGFEKLVARLCPDNIPKEAWPDLFKHYSKAYHAIIKEGYDESQSYVMLQRWLNQHVLKEHAVAIVTNKYRTFAKAECARIGFDSNLTMVCGDDVGKTKPAPDTIHSALHTLNVAPNQAVVVGDNVNDIKAARTAGCWSVGALYGHRPAKPKPKRWRADHLVESQNELILWLNQHFSGAKSNDTAA